MAISCKKIFLATLSLLVFFGTMAVVLEDVEAMIGCSTINSSQIRIYKTACADSSNIVARNVNTNQTSPTLTCVSPYWNNTGLTALFNNYSSSEGRTFCIASLLSGVYPSINIKVNSNISASWRITGPQNIYDSGVSGDYTMPPGTYTIIWGSVSGYNTPPSETLTATASGSNAIITFNGNYQPSSPPPPSVSCAPDKTVANTGEIVRWSVIPPSSSPGITYSWSGTDGLSGNTASVDKIYFTSGAKSASVNIATLGSLRPATYSCGNVNIASSVGIVNVSSNNSFASWTITGPSNKTGSGYFDSYGNMSAGIYTIVWNSVSGYNTPISESKNLTDGETINFSGIYNPIASVAPLSVSCSPSKTKIKINETVVWTASVSGGISPYSYSWFGSESLSGTINPIDKLYTTSGTKNAYVTVKDNDGQQLTSNCGTISVSKSSIIETPPR
ncbi:MAG: hypothetical protein US36_C0017G0021 [Candidatus Wolfebacteria bacterium GW2011_GWC1_37_10]|uniref:PKD domain-containing protein n=1 Tax=Candidatus Wolfebacteria bacterium GW2011_GWC1_37_10 TaxID=1619010 RepID=A0A0G0FRG4_9BACT|nr:MAG: hypothetical protein US36_C0017G0021 [Candidatus Wolfebacteria bacterium GW2011_GWC1_37_10]